MNACFFVVKESIFQYKELDLQQKKDDRISIFVTDTAILIVKMIKGDSIPLIPILVLVKFCCYKCLV